MMTKAFASILALFLLGLATSPAATAQTAEQSASGTYQFSLGDGYTKYVEFEAKSQGGGSATGQMTLSDEAKIAIQDVDGTGVTEDTIPGFFVKADFDSLIVDKNQAVMSGTITDSSIREFIGQRVLLTVEDNGDNSGVPDKLTWGIYNQVVKNWTPSDAELKEDPGVGLTWTATDAEQRDDKGIAMPKSEAIDANTFPVSSYAFVDAQNGAGDIRVKA